MPLVGAFPRRFVKLESRVLPSTALRARPPSKDALQLPAFNHVPRPYTGPAVTEVSRLRDTHVPKAVFSFYKKPLMIVEGKMQYVFDETGKRYLDGIAGIVTVSVGHCHPEVVEAMRKQQSVLGHVSSVYLHPEFALYAKELTSKFPAPLDQVFLVQSGSEANDLAMMLARSYSGNFDLIGVRNCYHGMTQEVMGLTGMGVAKQHVPQGFGIHRVGVPSPFHGLFGGDVTKYIQELHSVIESDTAGRIAGFICEPIQGVAGTVTLLDGYLQSAYEIVRKAGGVCISDEVQTGFGRTGKNFWGFQNHGVIPDIVTLAKGIGNGVPLAAVVTRKDIADTLLGKVYFNTFGATPPIVAGARAVLRVIEKEGLQQNADKVGAIIRDGLSRLQNKYDIIGDVRGMGLMLGIELIKDQKSKEPATAESAELMERLRDVGLLVGVGGTCGNVIRVKPPMCLSEEDGRFIVDAFDYALSTM